MDRQTDTDIVYHKREMYILQSRAKKRMVFNCDNRQPSMHSDVTAAAFKYIALSATFADRAK